MQILAVRGMTPTQKQMTEARARGLDVVMVRSCGHEVIETGRSVHLLIPVGTAVPCWPSCDRVPVRPGVNPDARFVARYEFRTQPRSV